MTENNKFDIRDLPSVLPIFPLNGVLLLPRTELPLNIFEPRYVSMVEDSFCKGRFIGMVQPQESNEVRKIDTPPVYNTGCVGRISSFSESDDGRYFINLSGIIRFHILEEHNLIKGYRSKKVDYTPYINDLNSISKNLPFRSERLKIIKSFFLTKKLKASWDSIEAASDEELINSLSILCPFESSEKQALLECPSLKDRSALLITLMEMAIHQGKVSPSQTSH